MPITTNTSGQVLDDVYVLLTNPPQSIQGVNTSAVGVVGTTSRGIPGAVYNFGDYGTFVSKLGISAADLTGPIAVQNLIRQKSGDIYFVPVFGTTASAASVTLKDAASTSILTLTFADTNPQTGVLDPSFGTDGNAATVTVTAGTGSEFNIAISTADGRSDTFVGLTTATAVTTINASATTCVASTPTGAGTDSPAAGVFNFSGGSNGTAADTDYVGSTSASGQKTGLAALESVGDQLSFVFAAEQSSSVVNAAVKTFGSTYNCIPVICDPQGTLPSAAETDVVTQAQKGTIFAYPWQYVYDADIQQNRIAAPTSIAAGVGSALGPEQSLGNKTVQGVLATDVQLSPTDISNLVSANLMVVGVKIPAGGIGIRNGQDSTGAQVFVTRMQYFVAKTVESGLGPYVDQLQSTSANDPLRRNVRGSVGMFLQSLMGDPNQGYVGQIDSYSVVCDLTNNSTTTIANDELIVDVSVNLLSNAGKIYVRANIGQGVLTTTSNAA